MFTPVVPFTGYAGFAFLERTYDSQRRTFDKSPLMTRDTEYFEANIGKISTAEELVKDRRLLRVALGAFGLQDDIDNRFFIRKVLEEGTLDEKSLANKLSDDRYKELSDAFLFDRGTPQTKISTFGAEIAEKFRRQEFEIAVGEQDESMRLALNADRVLEELSDSTASVGTQWFRIMGNQPLRKVFETAFGLPGSFGQIDLDQQAEVFRDRAEKLIGSDDPRAFAEQENRDKLVRTYLLRAQVAEMQTTTPGMIAQTLLAGSLSFMKSLRQG